MSGSKKSKSAQERHSTLSIRWKLAAAFIAAALFVAAFVGFAIAIQIQTVERAAQLEAAHVAEVIGESVMEGDRAKPGLQQYIARLNAVRKRDVVIVDARKMGLADADPSDIGKRYDHDPTNEVGKTILDGRSRAFVEKSAQFPNGARQIVVPIKIGTPDSSKPAVGAVILEYTLIREELLAEERNNMYLVCALGIVVVGLVTFFGLGIAKRIARPLQDLKQGAQRVAAQDYEARVSITSHDEIGLLGAAFNKMAEDLSVSHSEIVAQKLELESRVAQRTLELHESNAHLREEVGQHKLVAERAEYLAFYDSLTSLPNRSLFSKILNQAISVGHRNKEQLAVLFVDLDRFKNINDTLGHEAGDQLLKEVGRRMKGCLRVSDTIARLGGDEFVILLLAVHEAADVERVAQKVLAATSKSFVTHGQEFRVTASIGASMYPNDGDDEQSLMKNADIAMYQAKEAGKNHFQFYSEQMNMHSFERLALESSLRRALEHEEFQLHYQPKIDAKTGAIVGVEALLRWLHPELGMVAPSNFIPVAEETGLIVPIGKWVLETACAENVRWQESGLPHINMAVNLSGRQFSDEGLLGDVKTVLRETGMAPELLELEITESALMHDFGRAIGTLKAFRALGVRLAIDDFGTGYSSLSNLRQFPVDTIKIDGSFVRELSDAGDDQGIVEAIIAMGRALSLTVIAEGVETKPQADFLRARGCDEFQGYYFSRPVTAETIVKLLESQLALGDASRLPLMVA